MGIFAVVWPAWYYAACSAHLSVVWVVCLDMSNWDYFRAALRGTTTILLPPTHLETLAAVHIIGVNDVSTRGFYQNLLAAASHCPIILTTQRLRCTLPDGVYSCVHSLEHASTGGVSDRITKFSLFSRSQILIDQLRGFQFPDYPFAPLISVLDRKLTGKAIPAWKMSKQPLSERRVNLVKGSSLIHPLGLYPLSRSENSRVVAPCVYPSTPWIVRFLSPHEMGHVLDLPLPYMRALGPAALSALLPHLKTPLKPMHTLLQHLFYYAWPSLPSGDVNDSILESSSAPTMLDPVISPVETSAAATLMDSEVNNVVLVGGSEGLVGGSAGGDSISSPVEISVLSSGSGVDPSVITDEQRKAVALKSDNALVPVHVWRDNLSRILQVTIPPDVYEKGANVLRGRLLRHWKRGLFRHFILWAKNYYPAMKGDYAWCKGQFNWNIPASDSSPIPVYSAKKTVHWDKRVRRYVWFRAGNNFVNVGKKQYKDDWRFRSRTLGKSWVAARECVAKAAECSWWKWDGGSRLFFWRWPEEFMEEARDGCKCWFEKDKLPRYRVPQRPPSNPEMISKISEKLSDVIAKDYMSDGEVRSLTSFFDVMKGSDDIRMVYNGTSCGLNAACWAPWFPLPTIKTHLRAVEAGTWLADIDLGEMFLNFLLDERLREYAGVDVTQYFTELLKDGKTTVWKRWVRLLMGFTASPYLATRCLLRARRILIGDKDNPNNPFRWDHAVKNYPGLPSYDPLRPMVYKVRLDQKIAADVMKYIDDLRLTSVDAKEIWEVSMQIMTRLNWLGMQNAARKYREGALLQGAWAGAIVHTAIAVTASISQARWDKVKSILARMRNVVVNEDALFDFKQLLSDRGFLVYVSQTYPAMVPYLKGIHLTVDSWRPNRDPDGWKIHLNSKISDVLREADKSKEEAVDLDLCMDEIKNIVEEDLKEGSVDSTEGVGQQPPEKVKAATRVIDDLDALEAFFEGDTPVKRRVRAKAAKLVKFGFGDASGDGYGSGLATLRGSPNIRHGKWGIFYRTEASSNFRELRNLVDAVELEYKRGGLDGFELFLFTDNQVAERAYYKGTSSSRTLFNLILRLRKIEMEGRMILHVIHISGKRMIACGIDGLSRGDTSEGIGAGETMESFVPLHLDAIERSPTIIEWVHSWWPDELGKLHHLDIDDWFIWDETKDCCLWTPAPAGGEAAVEELANWIHYNPDRIHLVLMPNLWTCIWRKQLGKACIPGGSNTTTSWLNWKGKCGRCNKTLTAPTVDVFCGNFSSKRGNFDPCYSSWCASCYKDDRQVEFPRVIPIDDEGVVMPCNEEDLFLSARPGDTLMTPFQCELCHFRNIKGRNPHLKNARDQRGLLMVRRANLDAFWSRTSATVKSNLADLKQLLKHSTGLWGLVPSLPPRGPFPLNDSFGMSVATATLSRSLDPGRNAAHIQFNTARRIRSAYANAWNASLHTLETGVMQAGQSKLMVTDCPVYHYWYTKMMKGMHERMGDLVIQDQAISRELQIEIMSNLEDKLRTDRANYDRWVEVGTYVMSLWLGSLRGNEAMMADLGGCIQLMEESELLQTKDCGYGVLVLRGKFKTSTGYTKYLLYLSSQTKSPFSTPFRGWMKRLIEVRSRQGRTTGWLFSKGDGSQLEMTHYEVDLLRIISDIQDTTEGVIPKDMDVFDRYGVFRSWRRGSSSIARNEGVRKEDIDLNNGWRKEESSRGKHVASDMLAYYTEDLLVLKSKLRFSKAL